MSGILNVLGMAVAFAAFYIILVQVDYDLNFNKGIKDSEKIFVLSSSAFGNAEQKNIYFCRPLAEQVLVSSPNIEYGGCLNITNIEDHRYWMEKDGTRRDVRLNVINMGGNALKALGLETVSGSFDDFDDHSTLAISENTAAKFGLEVGMSLGAEEHSSVRTIIAIFKDMPENSHFRNLEAIRYMGDYALDNFSEWGFTYFIKINDPSRKDEMEKELTDITRRYYTESYFGTMPSPEEMGMTQEEFDNAVSTLLSRADCTLIPLGELYFSEKVVSPIEKGDRTTTVILLIVAILVVGIAFINYINFFFALIPERIRTVNTKKVLGCTRRELIISTMIESVTLIAAALVLAFILVMLFNMTQLTHLITADAGFGSNIGIAAATIITAITIAMVSSLYPAFYITSFEPAMVLKGSFGASKAGKRLRYILIGLQFIISIVLIIGSCFISLQRRYMVNFDMGFDKEQLLYVHTSNHIGGNAESVEERLKTDPQIKDATWAAGDLLATERMGWGRDFKGEMINFQCYPVAYDFPEFMGIGITEGRTFRPEDNHSENGVFIFNEAARSTYGFTLEDKVSGHIDDTDIVGFCEDFSFKSLKDEVSPFALYVFGQDPWWYPSTLFIRVTEGADYQKVMKHIGSILSQWEPSVSPDEWDIRFFDDNINATYKKEKALSQLISLFTLIAIIISLMGVFGLVMFETQYRRKEIALRRVNGATVNDILGMFAGRFVRIVLICYAVAAPAGLIIVHRYLATFAHRCPIYWWVFALSLLSVLAVTVGVVVLRIWKAATADPAEALKAE